MDVRGKVLETKEGTGQRLPLAVWLWILLFLAAEHLCSSGEDSKAS